MQFCEKGHMIYKGQPCAGCEAEKEQKPKGITSRIDLRVSQELEALRKNAKTKVAIDEITLRIPGGVPFDVLYQNIITHKAGFSTAHMQVNLSVHKGHIVFIPPQTLVDLIESSSGLVKGAINGAIIDISHLLCADCNTDKLADKLKPEQLKNFLHQGHDVAGGLLDLNSIKATGYGVESVYNAFKGYFIPKTNLN